MIKIIDRYFLKQFIQSFIFGLIAFTSFFAVIDMMENLDDFIDQNVSSDIIFQYYMVFIPEIIRLMTPVAVLLSCLFTVGRMATQNELTAIKSSGVSIYRIMTSFLVIGFTVSIISVGFGGYIVPMANKHKVFIEQNYMKKDVVSLGRNIFFQDSKTRIVSIVSYSVDIDQATRISIQEFDEKDITKMISRIDAERMKYDTLENSWQLINGVKRNFTDSTESAKYFDTLSINYLNFNPADVIKKQRKPEEMTLTELDEFATEQLRAGNDPTRIYIEYHSKIAFSFASLIVVLFGVPMSANKRKGGIALQFGISLLFTFIYLSFMQISQAFGKNGVLNPFLTAWFSNFFFLIVAVINIYKVGK
ncbi:MAG: LptF/LptG family permease [Ignavibacteria bacterium]|jgi:lipopolysaccharide export system permease protein